MPDIHFYILLLRLLLHVLLFSPSLILRHSLLLSLDVLLLLLGFALVHALLLLCLSSSCSGLCYGFLAGLTGAQCVLELKELAACVHVRLFLTRSSSAYIGRIHRSREKKTVYELHTHILIVHLHTYI